MEDKLYAIRVEVLDRYCGLGTHWLYSDYYILNMKKEQFKFTEVARQAKLYNNKNRAVKIANEVKDRLPDYYNVVVVEVEYIVKLEVLNIIEL